MSYLVKEIKKMIGKFKLETIKNFPLMNVFV